MEREKKEWGTKQTAYRTQSELKLVEECDPLVITHLQWLIFEKNSHIFYTKKHILV